MNDVVTVMAMGEWRRSWSAMIDASAVECTPFKGNCQTERYVLALLTWSMTNEQQHCTLQCHLIEYDRWWLRYVLTAGGTMWDRTGPGVKCGLRTCGRADRQRGKVRTKKLRTVTADQGVKCGL